MPFRRALQYSLVFLVASGTCAAQQVAASNHGLRGLDDSRPPVFGKEQSDFLAFIFARRDCPISNAYAPEVQRLHKKFAGRRVTFWIVYPEADDSAAELRQHQRDYGYPGSALLDPELVFTRKAKVRITPEAALFRANGELLYHGRIDDRYADFGKMRPKPTRRDFEDALTAALAGKPVNSASGPAVGCFIEGIK